MNHALDSIKGFIRLSGNASNKSMNNDIYDFSVLIFFFYISVWLGKVLQPFLVVWNFPLADWIKVNMDGADRGSPGLASCAEIFRGSMGEYVRGGGVSSFLGVQSSLVVEFMGSIIALEEAQKSWL